MRTHKPLLEKKEKEMSSAAFVLLGVPWILILLIIEVLTWIVALFVPPVAKWMSERKFEDSHSLQEPEKEVHTKPQQQYRRGSPGPRGWKKRS